MLIARIILAFLGAVAVVAVTSADAQEPTLRAEIISVRDAEYPYAEAIINVEDTAGGEPRNLTTTDFSVLIDGAAVPVDSADLASRQGSPLDVLLVIDTSGSMEGEPIARAREAAHAFVAGLAPDDRVAVISFGDDVRQLVDYTVDRAAIGAAIDGLRAVGNTALYQATGVAAIKVSQSTSDRRAVILLSDGADFGGRSEIGREDAINAAAASGAIFFTVAEGTGIDRDYLIRVADVTRGRYLEAPQPDQLGALYASIGTLLRSQYIVRFDTSDIVATGDLPLAVWITSNGETVTAAGTYRPANLDAPPIVMIRGVQPDEVVTGAREIIVDVQSRQPVRRVLITIDGTTAAELSAAPYTLTLDSGAFGGGAHDIEVTVEAGGNTVTQAVAFSTPLPPPVDAPVGPSLFTLIGGVIAAIGIAGAGWIFVRARRALPGDESFAGPAAENTPALRDIGRWAQSAIPRMPSDAPWPEPERESVGKPLGLLVVRGGPALGSEYQVGGSPVSIGSGRRCAVRIDDPALAGEEARTWVRNNQLMVHKMIRLTEIAADAPSGGWLILAPGDTFSIGEHSFEFRLLPQEAPAPAADVPPPDILARDAAPPARERRPGIFAPSPMPSAESQPTTEPSPPAAEPSPPPEPRPLTKPTPLFPPELARDPEPEDEQRAS
jgi:VWFA-related protein